MKNVEPVRKNLAKSTSHGLENLAQEKLVKRLASFSASGFLKTM